MTLTEYLDGMQAATSAAALDCAINCGFKHRFTGPTWSRISKVRIEAGARICDASHHAQFVPRFGRGRQLEVCGETYHVGRGQNSTGVRYCWHYAKEFAVNVLQRNGIGVRASHQVWDTAFDYPHRALGILQEFFAGKLPDPRLNRLIYTGRCITGTPIRVNRKSEAEHRSHRPCSCGGMLWDWGAGHSCGFEFINWRCDRCPRTYTEYMTNARLYEIRQRRSDRGTKQND